MADQITLDLGEYGSILVEPATINRPESSQEDSGLVQAGLGSTIRQSSEKILANAQEILQRPIQGIGNIFLAALTQIDSNGSYELSEFSVEVNVGISTETGTNVGVVAKIMPNGSFKCIYTWHRKGSKPEILIDRS